MSDFIILEFIERPPYVTIEGRDYYVDKNGRGIRYLLSDDHLMATCTVQVNHISKGAYHNLSQLKCIRIPSLVRSIGLYAFSNCSSLDSVIFDYGDDISIEDVLYDEHFETQDTFTEPEKLTHVHGHVHEDHLNLLVDCGKPISRGSSISSITIIKEHIHFRKSRSRSRSRSRSHSHEKPDCHRSRSSSSSSSSSSHSCHENNQKCGELVDIVEYNTSFRVFTINKIDVLNISLIKVNYGTKSVKILAIPYNCNSNVKIIGGTNLKPGSNLVTVIVTGEEFDSRSYNVIVFVKLLPDELGCLLEGTLVKTPEGYAPIETIREGDYIRTLKYDIVVTKVGEWEVNLNDEHQRNDLSRRMYKIPAGRLNCNKDTYISHYHRILIDDPSNAENLKLFRLPEKIGLEVANPDNFAVDGKYKFYHLQIKYGNYFIVSGDCIVESWETGAKYF